MSSLNPTFVESVAGNQRSPDKQLGPLLLARVIHVVLGPLYGTSTVPDPYYKTPADIGNITYQILQTNQSNSQDSRGNVVAKPLSATVKQIPVAGELVILIAGPSTKLNESSGQQEYYYLSPINLWNSNHHNAFPNLKDVAEYANSFDRTYQQTLEVNQVTNLSTTQSTNYPLDPQFVEKDNIKNLRSFTGDVTVEGRWGNSIRLGSTTVRRELNSWSRSGPVGNPITIIRNGQGRQENDIAWFPTVEDINRDPSSIYLTQGQEVVIDDINNNFSLASLGVSLTGTITVSVPLQQQLTSNDTISPIDQDQSINNGL